MMICTQTDYGRRPFEQLTMIIRNKIAFALLFILLHYCSCDVRNLVELPSYEIKTAVYIFFYLVYFYWLLSFLSWSLWSTFESTSIHKLFFRVKYAGFRLRQEGS